jgi:hypothetical protein
VRAASPKGSRLAFAWPWARLPLTHPHTPILAPPQPRYDVIFVLQHYVLYKDDSPTSTSPPGAGAGEAGRAGGAQAQVVATVPVAAERGREQPRRRSGVRAFAERVRTTVKGAKPQP